MFVDVVGISLAGGAGVEDALMVAAQAGNGPQFGELARAIRAAQTRRRKLWHALDDLGARCDIVALRELAAAVELAAESGSRIRETLDRQGGGDARPPTHRRRGRRSEVLGDDGHRRRR